MYVTVVTPFSLHALARIEPDKIGLDMLSLDMLPWLPRDVISLWCDSHFGTFLTRVVSPANITFCVRNSTVHAV